MNILFLTQTSEIGASARYRVYQYLDYLRKAGIEFDISPAIPDKVIKRGSSSKLSYYGAQLLRRLWDLRRIKRYDLIFLQRDIIIYLYPFIEKIISFLNDNIVFDFDDALYEVATGRKQGLLTSLLFDRHKIERIVKLSSWVIAGNSVLAAYARQYSANVAVIPTSVDISRYPGRIIERPQRRRLVFGWVGSDFTYPYLAGLAPVFESLKKRHDFVVRVIGAGPFHKEKFPVEFKSWSLNNEVKEILDFDIGVMPLIEDSWSKGKSATKLLQYMAAGVPAVASPVGVNREIIRDGVNGFLAKNKEEWEKSLSLLIEDARLRRQIAHVARKDVERGYSVQANASKFIEVIRNCLAENSQS